MKVNAQQWCKYGFYFLGLKNLLHWDGSPQHSFIGETGRNLLGNGSVVLLGRRVAIFWGMGA